MKYFLRIISIIVIVIFLSGNFLIYQQEKNIFSVWYGIVVLGFHEDEIIQISQNTYISFSENKISKLEKFMQEKNYDLIEQIGSGYSFKNKENEKIIVTIQSLSQKYILIRME